MWQVQVFQWVYGLQCVEMHCLLDEEGGEEDGQEDPWKNAKWHVRRVDQNAISQQMAWEKSGSEHQFHHGPKDIENVKRRNLYV